MARKYNPCGHKTYKKWQIFRICTHSAICRPVHFLQNAGRPLFALQSLYDLQQFQQKNGKIRLIHFSVGVDVIRPRISGVSPQPRKQEQKIV